MFAKTLKISKIFLKFSLTFLKTLLSFPKFKNNKSLMSTFSLNVPSELKFWRRHCSTVLERNSCMKFCPRFRLTKILKLLLGLLYEYV